jgi:hypothetical protein
MGEGGLGPDADAVLERIAALPTDWPNAGSLRPRVLERIARHLGPGPLSHSAETGTGKSTLLLSHLSAHHLVFTIDDRGWGNSFGGVHGSPLLRREAVEFVLGPTQQTLPVHRFAHPLGLVLIDGPHAFPFPQLEYYFLYPHLAEGALLVIDDLQVRSVNDLFRFVRADEMYELLEVEHTTAFLRRTAAPTFDRYGDAWSRQRYNQVRLPRLAGLRLGAVLKGLLRPPRRRAPRPEQVTGRTGAR